MPTLPTTTPPSVAELLDLLEQEQTQFDTLRELLAHERQCLRTLSSPELERLNQAKLQILTDIRSLERRRMATVTSLAREWQMPPEQLTLQLIGRRIGGSVAEHCRQRQDGLNHTLEAIQQANAVNRTVVTRSLDLLHDTLRLMRRHVEPPAVYSSSATPVGSLSGGAVIEREG